MRLNERPLVFANEELAIRAREMQAQGNKSFCPIVFLELSGGGYTWRGHGQKIPHGASVVATAKVYCPDDGLGRYLLAVIADEIENFDGAFFITSWRREEDFLGDHEVVIKENPLAVWFKKPRRR